MSQDGSWFKEYWAMVGVMGCILSVIISQAFSIFPPLYGVGVLPFIFLFGCVHMLKMVNPLRDEEWF
jgi:hypothetical protein